MSQLLLAPSLLVVYILTLGRLAAGGCQHVLSSNGLAKAFKKELLWLAFNGRALPHSLDVKLPAVAHTDVKVLRHSLSASYNQVQDIGQHWHDAQPVCALQDSCRHPFGGQMMLSTGVQHSSHLCLPCRTAGSGPQKV